MTHPLVGRRVKLIAAKDVFPTGIYEAGETGTITYVCDRMVSVKLDKMHESLNHWRNELHWDDDNLSLYDDVVEEFLKQVELI